MKGIEFADRKAKVTSASSLFNWEIGVNSLEAGMLDGWKVVALYG